MATTVRVPVLRELIHKDRVYHRGDVVLLTPIEAALLARQGLVSLSQPSYRTRQLVVDTPAAPVKRRRRYRRRDLVAESNE